MDLYFIIIQEAPNAIFPAPLSFSGLTGRAREAMVKALTLEGFAGRPEIDSFFEKYPQASSSPMFFKEIFDSRDLIWTKNQAGWKKFFESAFYFACEKIVGALAVALFPILVEMKWGSIKIESFITTFFTEKLANGMYFEVRSHSPEDAEIFFRLFYNSELRAAGCPLDKKGFLDLRPLHVIQSPEMFKLC